VGGKLLKICVGYFVRYCIVLREMLPVGHKNLRSEEKQERY
jgi:hypothetical protein